MKRFFSLLALSSISMSLQAVPVNTDMSVGVTFDDNVTRAEKNIDIQTDTIISGSWGYSFKPEQQDTSYMSIRATVEGDLYLDYTKLSNISQGIEFGFHARPDPGYSAIRYHSIVKAEYRLYGSSLRTGFAFEADVGLSKRITDRMSLRTGWIPEFVMASSSTFQAFNNRLYADLSLRTHRKNQLYFTGNYFVGDIVTTALEDPALAGLYKAWAIDDAFKDLSQPRWAYKFGGTALTLVVGDVYAVSSKQSIDASLTYYSATADAGVDYPGVILSVNYLQRF